jgi:hypothetical protein
MSNIDLSQIVTADDKAATTTQARVGRVKAECSRRIYALADAHAQMNLASVAAAGLLTAEHMATYQSGLGWIAAMRLTCVGLVGNVKADFMAEAAWPDIPSGVAELAAAF